jgi:hypothetical protein
VKVTATEAGMKVWIANFTDGDRVDDDVRVFASAEGAEKWRHQKAAELWDDENDGDRPSDPKALADEYWHEDRWWWFYVDEKDVEE